MTGDLAQAEAIDINESRNARSALLHLDGIHKSWGDRVVAAGVDLEIHAGSIVGIAGGNGAGKTTLLRIAAGVILPEAGAVRYGGEDIELDRPAFQQALGLLSAGDRGLYARLTVRQNLEFWGGLAGMERGHRRRRISDVLAEFGILDLADRRVDRLSMGQRQRVRLAMTFLHEPKIVLLDEPRTSLDESGISVLGDALAALASNGGAAIWASPEASEPLVCESWVLLDGALSSVRAKSRNNGQRPEQGTEDATTSGVLS